MPELRAHRLSKHFSGIRVVNNVELHPPRPEKSSATSVRMDPARPPPRECWPVFSNRRQAASNTTDATSATTWSGSVVELGYIPEEPYLYPFLSGREYLQLVGRLRELPEALLASKIDGFLDFVRAEHRRRPGDRVVLEGHAAEDRHLGGADARSVGGAVRRARDRPRRDDHHDAAAPGQAAGVTRQVDSLQLAHPRSGRARLRQGHRPSPGRCGRGRFDRAPPGTDVEQLARRRVCAAGDSRRSGADGDATWRTSRR